MARVRRVHRVHGVHRVYGVHRVHGVHGVHPVHRVHGVHRVRCADTKTKLRKLNSIMAGLGLVTGVLIVQQSDT